MEEDRLVLKSGESMRLSLEAIRNGQAGLNEHRKKLLERVPESGDWVILQRESVTVKDIAYLSAATQHEFALLRGKREDVLFHGMAHRCKFEGTLYDRLMTGKLELIAHTHADRGRILPSAADRNFLRKIGQEKSIIISYTTGNEHEFFKETFEELLKEVF
ncbi:MAG: hypothetical protein E7260_11145 [Lachnospiraceae bacterium]|nr:hypothetical protein [Lachnospiraceae bacterium]